MKKSVKFGVFTDLHHGLMHDAPWRLQKFLEASSDEDVDFIIQLGDFCHQDLPRDEKQIVIDMYNNFPNPHYHVLGNHDMDLCSKKDALLYLGEEKNYYSFDCNGYHFIVLDCNYFYDGSRYFDYCCGNYKLGYEYMPFLPPEELEWLEANLRSTSLPIMIFSHQCLKEGVHSLQNAEQLRTILRKTGNRVKMSINGHNHMDDMELLERVFYFNLNGISNQWLGEKYISDRYNNKYDEKFPALKMTAPYKEPLYAIITATSDSIDIKGVESEFVGKSPYELRYPYNIFRRECVPRVTSRYLSLD